MLSRGMPSCLGVPTRHEDGDRKAMLIARSPHPHTSRLGARRSKSRSQALAQQKGAFKLGPSGACRFC